MKFTQRIGGRVKALIKVLGETLPFALDIHDDMPSAPPPGREKPRRDKKALKGAALPAPLSRRGKLLVCWGVYTALFALIFIVGYNAFWAGSRSFVWWVDGSLQHVVSLRYFSQYWRDALQNIFSGNFQIPLYDFRIGMGEDVNTVARLTSIADVFYLLSVFVPPEHMASYYYAGVIFCHYLSGVTFSILCLYARQKNWAVLLGSLIYVFCGFALFAGVRHPFYINPMIYAPLAFLGLDLVLRGKKPFLFILSVFLLALNGFYFLYMVTIFLPVYALIRIHHLHGKAFWKNLFPLGLRAAFGYILGLMMAGMSLLPMILRYFDSYRTKTSGHANVDNLWFNDMPANIRKFIYSIGISVSWDFLGLAAIALLALAALAVAKRDTHDKRHLLGFCAFAALIYIIPFGGFMMNGFGYVSQRWTFLFALILAFVTVYMLPRMMFIGKRERAAFLVLICLYGFLSVFIDDYRSVYSLTALCMLALSAICLDMPLDMPEKIKTRRALAVLSVIVIVAVNLMVNARYMYNGKLRNYASDFLHAGSETEAYGKLPALPASIQNGDPSFYRVDIPSTSLSNAPLYLDYNGLPMYWSMAPASTSKGLVELENFPMDFSFRIRRGFDGRTPLNTLASVKYFAKNERYKAGAPYGYELLDTPAGADGDTTAIYENKYALPLGYTYDKAISYDEYRALPSLYKQEALLQAVALDPEYAGARAEDLQFEAKQIPYRYKTDGIVWENGVLDVKKDGAKLTLTFESLKNSETYVRLSGFDCDSAAAAILGISSKIISEDVEVQFPKSNFYFGRHDYLCNLGYSENLQKKATITFSKKGRYSLEKINLYCYPLQSYPEQVEALKKETLENIEIGVNRVSGDITVSKNKFLVLSLPYSNGWSATVDGRPQALLQANTLFMALPLEEGAHKVELRYRTPGIRAGAALSAIGLLTFAGLIFRHKRFKKKEGSS